MRQNVAYCVQEAEAANAAGRAFSFRRPTHIFPPNLFVNEVAGSAHVFLESFPANSFEFNFAASLFLVFFSPSAFLIIMYLGCEMSATIYCTRCGYSLTTDTVAVIIYIYILYFMTATTKYLNNLLNRKIIDVSLCFFAGKLC